MKRLNDEQIKEALIRAIAQGQEYTTTNGKPEAVPERAIAQAQLEQAGEETRRRILAVQDMWDGMGEDSESFRRSDWRAT